MNCLNVKNALLVALFVLFGSQPLISVDKPHPCERAKASEEVSTSGGKSIAKVLIAMVGIYAYYTQILPKLTSFTKDGNEIDAIKKISDLIILCTVGACTLKNYGEGLANKVDAALESALSF